jgi:hypothetical protein
MALVKIRTSSLPGASLAMTSGGGRRWGRCTPLVDLDCGRLQISIDGVKCRGFWELVEFVHGDGNIGARCLENLLVVAHVKSVSHITADIALATRGCISCIFFSILQVDSTSPTIGVSFLSSSPLLIGFPIARGLVVTNGEDGASKAGRKGWELLPIWIDEGAGIASPMRFGGPSTLFRDCRERILSDLPNIHHVNSRHRVVWFRQVYQTEI